jgi:hypothetical protein
MHTRIPEIPDRAASIQSRLLTSAHRLERLADDRDLPGSTRLTYRDLAGQCRAQADSLGGLQ